MDFLFIVHDAGESNFALPLVDNLLRRDKEVKVLALGEPGIKIYESFANELVTPTSLGLETSVNDDRNQTLTEQDVKEKVLVALSLSRPLLCRYGVLYIGDATLRPLRGRDSARDRH